MNNIIELPNQIDYSDRDVAIATIKQQLKQRTKLNWSVTGGRGTSWGWIKIDAQPKDKTWHHVKLETPVDGKEYELKNTGKRDGCMGPFMAEVLKAALGLDRVDYQGVSIPAGSDYRREYVERAMGKTPTKLGQPYWD